MLRSVRWNTAATVATYASGWSIAEAGLGELTSTGSAFLTDVLTPAKSRKQVTLDR
jgi:hypothetical protein